MATWNPRYVAYARAAGRSPEAQIKHDREKYPGLCMVGFSFWIEDRWRDWEKAAGRGKRTACSDEDHRCFDTWLEGYVSESQKGTTS